MRESRISQRQLTRMIYIEGVGASGLTFPAVAAFRSQSEGLWPVALYALWLVLFAAWLLFVIRRLELRKPAAMYAGYGFALNRWLGLVYMARLFLNSLALFSFFGLTIRKIYMPDRSMFLILLPFALLLWYCSQTTLQKRARFMELLFPWIVSLFLILVLFALLALEGRFHVPPLQEESGVLFNNSYVLLLCTTPLEFLLFLMPAVTGNLWADGFTAKSGKAARAEGTMGTESTQQETAPECAAESLRLQQSEIRDPKQETWWRKRCNQVWRAVGGVLLWNVLLWFVTIENLGGQITASSPWPVIKVMQLIRLPGGFLERFDILLAMFWILCLVGVLSGYLYYGRKIGEEIFGGRLPDGRTLRRRAACVTAAVITLLLLLSCRLASGDSRFLFDWFLTYKKWIDFPLLILLPLLAAFTGRPADPSPAAGNALERKLRSSSSGTANGSPDRKSPSFSGQTAGISPGTNRRARFLFLSMLALIILPLTGCGSQTDVEEKSYVLTLYVDIAGDAAGDAAGSTSEDAAGNMTGNTAAGTAESATGNTAKDVAGNATGNVAEDTGAGDYEYWLFTADLSAMESQEDSIPCNVIHFIASDMAEMEQKYARTAAGTLEWNHIDTIFLGPDLIEDPQRTDIFLREWEASWQKSPDVLLSVCLQQPEELLDIKNIPDGTAGQEVNRIVERAEQGKERIFGWNLSDKGSETGGISCRTPIEVLKAKAEGERDISLCQTKVQWKRLVVRQGYRLPG